MILVAGHQCYSSRGLAAVVGVGRNTMLREFRSAGVLDHDNLPTRTYAGKRFFFVHVPDAYMTRKYAATVTYYNEEFVAVARELCKDLPRKKVTPYVDEGMDVELIKSMTD
jgi:hypothetical protein